MSDPVPGLATVLDVLDAATPALTDALSWDGDRLVLDGGASGDEHGAMSALAKLARPRLSPSTASALRKCPARAAIDRLLPSVEDPLGPAELGTSTHALLEDLFALPSHARTIDAAEHLLADLHLRRATDISPPDPDSASYDADLAQWRRTVLHMATGLWEIENPSEVMVASTELRLNTVEVAGVPFVGFLDRVDIATDRRGRPGRRVVDYKTGGVPKPAYRGRWRDDHQDQVRLYALAVAQLDNGRLPVAAELYYVTHRTRHSVDLDRSELDIVEHDFAQAWTDLSGYVDQRAFPAKSSPLCGWCPLATVCPVAARDGKNTPRIDSARAGELLNIRTVAPLITPVDPDTVPGPISVGELPAPSLHTSTAAHPNGEPVMSEARPWEETDSRGDLNLTSYAAMAVFGMVELATETLHTANQPITQSSVRALSATFAAIVVDAQEAVTGSTSWQDGSNTRMRGALRSVLVTMAPPFGEDEQAWASWVARARRRTESIATTAIALWVGYEAEPWLALAVRAESAA